jgi:DNA-binding transcriptional regulator YdaS (Cro superfamily)
MKLAEYIGNGSYTDFGRLIGCTPQQVGRLVRGSRQASPRMARLIEQATNGTVTREELRPDIFGEIEV